MCGRYRGDFGSEAIRALFGYPEQPNFLSALQCCPDATDRGCPA